MEILLSHSCEPSRLLADLLDLPPKPLRSKLEPHRELIRELRRKGRTYREVSRLFAERLGLQVAPSTLHSFVKVRARHRKQVQFELPAAELPSAQPPVSARPAAFKAKPTPQESKRSRFVFCDNEPVTLSTDGGARRRRQQRLKSRLRNVWFSRWEVKAVSERRA
jgi:hypothetical protein